jgi:hypothetical protein
MNSLYTPKKRIKKSKFDPFKNEIEEYMLAGMSTPQIAVKIQKHFDETVDESALYGFTRSRGLRNRVTRGGTNLNYKAPRCENCEDCYMGIAMNGKYKIKICGKNHRVIGMSVNTSPMWCEKRR